tara:strand:- start:3281 stop:3685 length:405 start_codon:yes stop_codon:yes gene_type:complete
MKFIEKIRTWEPVMIENSRVPIILSKIAPINIHAISFAFWVFCRGTMTKTTRRHETIHFQQQLEMGFIFQWLLYGIFWLVGLAVHRDASTAYRASPFEQEAYHNEKKRTYLQKRKLWSWRKYSIRKYTDKKNNV